MERRSGLTLLAVATLATTAAAADASPTAKQVAAKVEAYYANAKHATVRFEQIYRNTTFGTDTKSKGTLRVKRPKKMRWDYGKPKVSYLTDGRVFWMVDVDNKQAMRKPLGKAVLPVAVTFLAGTGKLTRHFNVALSTAGTYGGKGDYVLELTPKQASAQFSTLWLVVDSSSFRVKESIVLEASGNTNRFVFGTLDSNKAVADSQFKVSKKDLLDAGFKLLKP